MKAGVHRMRANRIFASAIVVAVAASSAGLFAAPITFEGLPASTNGSGSPNNPASVLTNQFANLGIIFGRPGVSAGVSVMNNSSAAFSDPNSISGLDVNGNLVNFLTGDVYFHFVVPNTATPATVDSVSFRIGDDGGDVDNFQIRAYDLNDNLIFSQNIGNSSHIAVSINVAGIHRVEADFDNNSTTGFGLDDLDFDEPVGQAVPEPASIALWTLLGIGGVGCGFRRWQKRRKSIG